ncbi:methyltransferase [Hymenobacter sp. BT664]|uniref:tRNA1(Val) (adenine(37)-N6)-methyltransferase n=1 Tax=Hymenobacter montanus TaxID=2771359 RepID=A0A927BD03_9BACT|nr:methyltransferase [Hymenobacter montanus]MBD2767792.1 methyltransferase [Hymenobacter montanus]
MPNNYFQFQQFRIEQGACAMKVSTDACLLGAAADLTGATRLLDIGTGTGLLALMAAQRHPTVEIEALEIDAAAAAQAAANAAASPWGGRIRVWALSLAEYVAGRPAPLAETAPGFSHIVCNPPFFRHSLRSPDARRTTARHEAADTLTFDALAGAAATMLAPGGLLTMLLPPLEMRAFEQVAAAVGLHPATRLVVRHRPGSRPLRHITGFRSALGATHETELSIRTAEDDALYSADFRALLAGFYLDL